MKRPLRVFVAPTSEAKRLSCCLSWLREFFGRFLGSIWPFVGRTNERFGQPGAQIALPLYPQVVRVKVRWQPPQGNGGCDCHWVRRTSTQKCDNSTLKIAVTWSLASAAKHRISHSRRVSFKVNDQCLTCLELSGLAAHHVAGHANAFRQIYPGDNHR